MCPSSGELLYQCDNWFMSLCVDDRLVCRSICSCLLLHTGRSSTQSDINQVSHWYNNSTDDGHIAARNIYRIEINIHERLCVRLVIYRDHTSQHGQQNIKFGYTPFPWCHISDPPKYNFHNLCNDLHTTIEQQWVRCWRCWQTEHLLQRYINRISALKFPTPCPLVLLAKACWRQVIYREVWTDRRQGDLQGSCWVFSRGKELSNCCLAGGWGKFTLQQPIAKWYFPVLDLIYPR